MSTNKGLRTHLSPQSWARGIWRGGVLSAPCSFSLHSLLPIFLPFGFSSLLCSLPQLSSLLPLAGCHNQPCLALSLSSLLPPPSCSFQPSFGDTIPLGRSRGKNNLMVPPNSSSGIRRPSLVLLQRNASNS